MKKAILIIMLFAGFNACERKPTPKPVEPEEPTWGADSASMIINDTITWTANGSRNASINDTILELSLDMNKQLSNGLIYAYESFSFRMLRKNTSIQKLDSFGSVPLENFNSPEVKFFTTDNYDTGNEVFVVYKADSANNWIQITEQRNNYKEIKGKFSVTLIKRDSGSVYKYPDTLRIRNGYFRVTIKD